jgi:hypothetical protein
MEVMMAANTGQSRAAIGPYDPRKKETSATNYFRSVQADLNKRFGRKGMKKKNSPTKEK